MDYGKLGDTGLIVSRLALGTMTFTGGGRQAPSIAKVDRQLADRIVGTAIDAGVNFIDTADVYDAGHSEIILGQVIAERRKELVVATKVGVRSGRTLTRNGLSRRHILMSIDESLERLGTDWVDLYIAHAHDPFTPLAETLEALDQVVRSGKARYLGCSNWPAWRVAAAVELQKANGWARFCNAQVYYSLLGRDVEREIVPMAAHQGLGLTIWSPLAFGFLSGKYSPDTLLAGDSRFADADLLSFDKDVAFAVVDRLREIAAAHGATVAQVALAWLLSRPGVTSLILGVSRVEQLDENLASMGVALSADELRILDDLTRLSPTYPGWMLDRFVDKRTLKALAPQGPLNPRM